MLFRHVLPAVVLALLCGLAASGQIAADLRGRVVDPSGLAVANAAIDLTQAGTNTRMATVSSGSGDYSFTNLTPGVYQVDVTARGFAHLTRVGIHAIVGQTVSVKSSLSFGGGQQTVTVTADAPLLQADDERYARRNIAGPTVVAMPLNTRNFIQLATLAPGVELPPGTVLPRINGGRPRTNEYLYDGISALQPEPGQVAFFPIIDDIQEFTVEANNVPAEFGRFNGGVVNVATRSGSNALHGSLFEFFRNEDLNARNYFAPAGRGSRSIGGILYGGDAWRAVVAGHALLLWRLPGSQAADRGDANLDDADAGGAAGNLYGGVEDLRSDDDAGGERWSIVRTGVPERRDQYAAGSGGDGAAGAFSDADESDVRRRTTTRARRTMPIIRTNLIFEWMERTGTRDRAFGRYSYYNDVEQPVTPLPDGSGRDHGRGDWDGRGGRVCRMCWGSRRCSMRRIRFRRTC